MFGGIATRLCCSSLFDCCQRQERPQMLCLFHHPDFFFALTLGKAELLVD
jgi:hypothetical protein